MPTASVQPPMVGYLEELAIPGNQYWSPYEKYVHFERPRITETQSQNSWYARHSKFVQNMKIMTTKARKELALSCKAWWLKRTLLFPCFRTIAMQLKHCFTKIVSHCPCPPTIIITGLTSKPWLFSFVKMSPKQKAKNYNQENNLICHKTIYWDVITTENKTSNISCQNTKLWKITVLTFLFITTMYYISTSPVVNHSSFKL